VLVIFRVNDSDLTVVLACVFASIPDVDKIGMRIVDNTVRTRFKLDRVE